MLSKEFPAVGKTKPVVLENAFKPSTPPITNIIKELYYVTINSLELKTALKLVCFYYLNKSYIYHYLYMYDYNVLREDDVQSTIQNQTITNQCQLVGTD